LCPQVLTQVTFIRDSVFHPEIGSGHESVHEVEGEGSF
jgi:hypothetical protein